MIFFDTETCGLHGCCVLIQYADGDGDIVLYEVFHEPIQKTLDLIEWFCEEGVCGFNLAFDWFHIQKLHNVLDHFASTYDAYDELPINHIEAIALGESEARLGPCVKPKTAMDLMLHARKGPYQSTMERSPVTVRRIPTVLAELIRDELNKRIPLKDIYFARYKDKKQRWKIQDITDDFDEIIPEFKNIVLNFNPSSGLKALASDALGVKDAALFEEIMPPKGSQPTDIGYAPYATAPYKDKQGVVQTPTAADWCGKWPDYGKVRMHITHWRHREDARKYAWDDVDYTRRLYKYFGSPEAGDNDSILACLVGSVRWRGFSINKPKLTVLRNEALIRLKTSPLNFSSPTVCRVYLIEALSEQEQMVLKVGDKITTGGVVLEEIARWKESTVHDDCFGQGCDKCNEGLVETETPHPAAIRASEILKYRRAKKQIEMFDKLLQAGRFHASFKVIGTLSSRMAGADGLNPQGINHSREIRECFDLADQGLILCGGDFDGFEVTIMIARYDDDDLRSDYLRKIECVDCKGVGCDNCDSGQAEYKLYGVGGEMFFPGKSYADIILSKGLPNEEDLYDRSKKGVLAIFYGGEGYTLANRVGISQDRGDVAFELWGERYKKWAAARKEIFDMFCSMSQPDGAGSAVKWAEPVDFIESMMGFRRYFTLENRICKTLFDMGEEPPESWKNLKIKVIRRQDRGEQTVSGASRSACFGAAFGIQGSNMRAAANHVIQSTGAQLTKGLQVAIWALQPVGVHDWNVQPINIHDEVMSCTRPSLLKEQERIVNEYILEMRQTIPLLGMSWKSDLSSWAGK